MFVVALAKVGSRDNQFIYLDYRAGENALGRESTQSTDTDLITKYRVYNINRSL